MSSGRRGGGSTCAKPLQLSPKGKGWLDDFSRPPAGTPTVAPTSPP